MFLRFQFWTDQFITNRWVDLNDAFINKFFILLVTLKHVLLEIFLFKCLILIGFMRTLTNFYILAIWGPFLGKSKIYYYFHISMVSFFLCSYKNALPKMTTTESFHCDHASTLFTTQFLWFVLRSKPYGTRSVGLLPLTR